jgi:DNA repair protein RadA/Sms
VAKRPTAFVCLACSAGFDEYAEVCEKCLKEDTICERDTVLTDAGEARGERPKTRVQKLSTVSPSLPPKTSTGRTAWDIALGGGLTRPSSVLVQGPKGVGKSTSALRIADYVSTRYRKPALYGSAEMPKEHVRRLGDALGLKMTELYILDAGHLEDMVDAIEELSPILIIWDSIQRFQVEGELGDIPLRMTVSGAIRAGNRTKAASILLSQVTKEEVFIGRSEIGHDVDVVLSLKRESRNEISITCPDKNRFAPTPTSARERLYEGARTHAARAEVSPPPRAPTKR